MSSVQRRLSMLVGVRLTEREHTRALTLAGQESITLPELFRRLLRERLDDYPRHIIEFRVEGWTIRHPLACRPHLFDCPVNRAAEADPPPPDLLGHFEVEVNDLGDRLLIGDPVALEAVR